MAVIMRIVTTETVPRVVGGPYDVHEGMVVKVDFPVAGTITYQVQIKDDGGGTSETVEEISLIGLRVRR